MFVNIIEKRGDECETYTEAIKKSSSGGTAAAASVFLALLGSLTIIYK